MYGGIENYKKTTMQRGDIVLIKEDQTSTLPTETNGCLGVITDFLEEYSWTNCGPFVTFRELNGSRRVFTYSENEVKVVGHIESYSETPTKPCTCSIDDLLRTGCVCGSVAKFKPKPVMS